MCGPSDVARPLDHGDAHPELVHALEDREHQDRHGERAVLVGHQEASEDQADGDRGEAAGDAVEQAPPERACRAVVWRVGGDTAAPTAESAAAPSITVIERLATPER